MNFLEIPFPTVLALQAACAFFMCGVIWVIQLVQYPGFILVGAASFENFHERHSSRITWIVLPIMLLELVSAIFLVAANATSVLWWLNIIGVALIWILTAVVSVPLHSRLKDSADRAAVCQRLVTTNWLRTILWSLRAVLLFGVLWQMLSSISMRSGA